MWLGAFAICRKGEFLTATCEQVRIASRTLPDVSRWQTYAEDMHRMGIYGQGIEWGIVDSGVWMDDPETAAAVVGGINLSGEGDFGDLQDRVGHGGLVLKIMQKIAPKLKFRVFRIFGSSNTCEDATAGRGLLLSGQSPVMGTNASIGGPSHPSITEAVRIHAASLKPLIAAAGNHGDGKADTTELSAPADDDYTTAIGAVDRGYLADTAQDFMPLVPSGYSASSPKVDGVALGRIPESWDEGTSFAAPVVSGLSALFACYCKQTGRPWNDTINYGWLNANQRQLPGLPAKNDQTGFGFYTTRPFQPPILFEVDPVTGEAFRNGQPWPWPTLSPINQGGRLYYYGVDFAKALGCSGAWNPSRGPNGKAQYRN